MVRYEYEGNTIEVPTGWHELTLGDWDRLHRMPTKTDRDRVEFVLAACKADPDTWRAAPVDIFNMVVSNAAFLFTDPDVPPSAEIAIGGKRFVIPIEDSLTLGEWVDIDELQKSGEGVLVGVLSTVCRPAGEKYDPATCDARRPMFAALTMTEAYPLLGFFLQCAQRSQKLSTMSSMLNQLAAQLPPSMLALRGIGVGTRLLRIWPITKYLVLNALLRYRLSRHSRLYGTGSTSASQTPHRGK